VSLCELITWPRATGLPVGLIVSVSAKVYQPNARREYCSQRLADHDDRTNSDGPVDYGSVIKGPVNIDSRKSSCGLSPVFLVGAQRSGSTALGIALSRAFASVGGCFTVNGKLPYLLKRWWTQDDLRSQHLRTDEVEHSLRRVPACGVNADAWLTRATKALRASATRAAQMQASASVEEEVRVICEQAYGAHPWGDKYNEYMLDLPWLSQVFPTARWIFIVREPADVIASMLAWSREKIWNPQEAHAATAKWSIWNDNWLRFRQSLPPDRVFEIGYEQLADDGCTRLSHWLGLDVAKYLDEFKVQRNSGVDLTADALEVRRSLVQLGLLVEQSERVERNQRSV
jgi:hypothetical protein